MISKAPLSWDQQIVLLTTRELAASDWTAARAFLRAENYYRFSGYARYFQRAPHHGDDRYQPGTTFEEIRAVYDADEQVRSQLTRQLTRVELMLRSHTAHVIANLCGAYGQYLQRDFYLDIGGEPTVESCIRDIARSKERHILRFRVGETVDSRFDELPVWSAVEAWSFGTLSKAIERGARGSLAGAVAASLGVAHAGFANRVRALVYLRNRCAHHSRLWNHSVIDAGPTPSNVRAKAKRITGQFEPRSVLDVVSSLDDIAMRGMSADPVLPALFSDHGQHRVFWQGLLKPLNPRDHREELVG